MGGLVFIRQASFLEEKHGHLVAHFPAQLVEWEVLISLGAFENEVGGSGKIVSIEKGIKAKSVSHPLLLPEIAVPNDFEIDGNQRIILLTGANMSGKTTLCERSGLIVCW